MISNLDRFSKDLDRLIDEGDQLKFSMIHNTTKDVGFIKQVEKKLGKKKALAFIKSLPNFNLGYEAWYSETLALLKQLLPDRVKNFVDLYEKPKVRKEISPENYVIQDYLQGLEVTLGGATKADPSAALPNFAQQLAILKAAKSRFSSSLFEIQQLVQADIFDSEISAARELHKKKFYRAAGVIAGVVLEKHLLQVCHDHGIKTSKKNPTLSDLSEALKANVTIDVPQWRHLSFMADIRNLCAHNKQKDPTVDQVSDLLDGTEKVIETIA